jgi:integrase
MASDFLDGLDVSKRTRKIYRTSLKCLLESARERGRFTGENHFVQKGKRIEGNSYEPFEVPELQVLLNALPREVAPTRHSPDTALPWIALVALYTGARLEEICQLTTADVREEGDNGAAVWVIDIHNGGQNKLKTKTSARIVPVHRQLVRLGFVDYVRSLPPGPLFPGLKRRASKGDKLGGRVGELFRKKLIATKLKRKGLCFHSFRHTLASALDRAGVTESDSNWILGHAHSTESRRTYSSGPGPVRLKAEIDKVEYAGLHI